jgi:hypothetical protein
VDVADVGFGVGFRVAPGVRLRATNRGPRVSVGPRITRIHLGGGQPAASVGAGPFTVWSTLAGGGHAPPAGDTGSRKAEEWGSVRSYLDGLLSAHAAPVERVVRPTAPPPEEITARAVRRDLRRRATAELPWWRLGARFSARAEADRRSDAEVARRRTAAREQAAAAQAEADAWWARLLANEPDTVIAHLDRALVEHAMPATVTAVEGDRAHLVVPVLTVEKLIGPREPTMTDAGNLSLKRITKTRRHALHEAAVTSAMVAVAAETFALAPGIMTVDLAVVAPAHLGGPAVLMLAELQRDTVLPDGADRPVDGDLVAAAEAGRATLVRDKGGRVGALRPLPDHDPDVRALLDVLDME